MPVKKICQIEKKRLKKIENIQILEQMYVNCLNLRYNSLQFLENHTSVILDPNKQIVISFLQICKTKLLQFLSMRKTLLFDEMNEQQRSQSVLAMNRLKLSYNNEKNKLIKILSMPMIEFFTDMGNEIINDQWLEKYRYVISNNTVHPSVDDHIPSVDDHIVKTKVDLLKGEGACFLKCVRLPENIPNIGKIQEIQMNDNFQEALQHDVENDVEIMPKEYISLLEQKNLDFVKTMPRRPHAILKKGYKRIPNFRKYIPGGKYMIL